MTARAQYAAAAAAAGCVAATAGLAAAAARWCGVARTAALVAYVVAYVVGWVALLVAQARRLRRDAFDAAAREWAAARQAKRAADYYRTVAASAVLGTARVRTRATWGQA